MKILILGGSGHVGAHLGGLLRMDPRFEVWTASRRPRREAPGTLVLDTLDELALRQALQGIDCVVNCVAGDATSIGKGAQVLVRAALASDCPAIVHFSTMAVYGTQHGLVRENAPVDGGTGWYGAAKCYAEQQMQIFSEAGGRVVVFRPGCIAGPGSHQWVGRIGRLLRSRRLGDIGAVGDGWSNLVHVDDACRAAVAAIATLARSPGADHERVAAVSYANLQVFNLVAPDSPRWSRYFIDLGMAIGATPVRRLSGRRLQMDANVLGIPLKIADKLSAKLRLRTLPLPEAITPALIQLWSQPIKLDSQALEDTFSFCWTPYQETVRQSADWLKSC